MFHLLLLLITCGLSYVFVALIRRWADKRNIFDVPISRSSHTRPTPYGGGLAIAALVLAGWLGYGLLTQQPARSVLTYLFGGGLIAAVGWIDDLKNLSPATRILAQVIVAVLAVWGLGYWHTISLPFGSALSLGWLGLVITIVWIVGLINAYNFMDGIDGLAGGTAALAGLGWILLLNDTAGPQIALIQILGLFILGSSLGFLGHNWSPARIFMGDVGSVFLGYTFAIMPLLPAEANQPQLSLISAFLLWPFIFDTGFTFLRRLRNGERVFSAHRSHLYQRLIIAGFSHQTVTLFYLVLSLLGLTAAWLWLYSTAWGSVLGVVLVGLACVGLWGVVQVQEHKKVVLSHEK